MNQIYLSKVEDNDIMALRENNSHVEIIVEDELNKSIVSNIYKAKVLSISEGLSAAFIDYGERKKGFLPLLSPDGKVQMEIEGEIDEAIDGEMYIKQNDEILVQVIRDEISTKGAKLTSYLSIPGNFLVLMPNVHFVGISRKIRSRDYKNDMKKFLYSIIDPDVGVIARTAITDANKHQIKREYNDLVKLWREIQKNSKTANTPSLLYKESGIIVKTIRDLIKRGLDEIHVETKEVYNDVMRYFSFVNKTMKKKVHLYQFSIPMLAYFDIDKEIETMFRKEVYLKHGAYIIIEQTEALTAIDVNSGKMSKNRDNDNLIRDINVMAAETVAKQLRLRDIGGIIVIDFIDMKDENSKRDVLKELKKYLRADRSHTKVLKISQLGLVEMTRKRVGPSVINYFVEKCITCEGKGYTPKPIYTAFKLIRWVREHGRNYRDDTLIITARKNIVSEMQISLIDYIETVMKDWRVNIKIESNENVDAGVVEIYSYNKLEKVGTIR